MGVNFHNKDEYNKRVETTTQTSAAAPSSAASEESQRPNSVIETTPSDTPKEGFIKSEEIADTKPEATPTLEEELAELIAIPDLERTPEQNKRIEEIKQGLADAAKKSEAQGEKQAQLPPEKERKLDEYAKVRSSGGTAYEKVSKVMDKYLSENDAQYKKLKTEKEKQKYRDSLIHELQAVVNPNIKNKDLSILQRKQGLERIADLYTMAGVSGKSIETLTSIGSESLEKLFNEHNKMMFIKMADSIKLDDNTISADEKINRLADILLRYDEKYLSLPDKEKQAYREQKIADFISDEIGMTVSAKMLNSEDGKVIKAGLIEFLKEFKNAGDFGMDSLSPKRTAQALRNAIGKNMDLYTPQMKERAEQLIARCDIIIELTKNGNEVPKENDVYDYLLKKGENRTQAETALFNTYKAIIDSGYNINGKEASIRSITAKSLLTNRSDSEITKLSVDHVLKKSNKKEILSGKSKYMQMLAKEIRNTNDSTKAFNTIMQELERHFTPEEMKNIKKLYNINSDFAYAHESLKSKKNIDDIKQTEAYSAKYGTSEDKNNIAKIAKVTHKNWNKHEQAKYMTDVHNEDIAKFGSEIIDAANYGFNHAPNRSNEDLSFVQDQVQNSNLSDAFKQFSVKSMTSNATAGQQQYIINLYENTTDKNIIKGLAAAEPNIHNSVKQEYSEKLDKIIENNGLQNDKEIQTARQTGQTSYEREQAQKVSAESPNKNASNSAANSSSKSQVSTTPQGTSVSSTSTPTREIKVTTGVLYISAESKTYTKDISATLSQLDSEVKKADAMKKVADNIAKIQAENLKYEEAAEKKKTAEQKQLAESIKAENEEKTEEQLKAELSSALEGEIANVESEISSSPEATEVQKQLGSMFEELRSYAKAGQMDQVFSMLSKIPNAQEKFLEKLATKHISTITHFIKGADKSILKFMCEKNPGIISTLDTNTLMTLSNSGFPKTMLIKYGDKNQIAGMFKDLQGTNNGRKELEGFYEIMGLAKDELDISDASAVIKKNFNIEGGDDFMNKLHENMKNASNNYSSSATVGSTVVPSWKEPDKKVPREMWG